MIRMNPLRRLGAAVAITAVTALGGVALASPALAQTGYGYNASADTASSAATSSSPGVDASALLAGLFSKQKAIGVVALPKDVSITVGDIMSARQDTDPAYQSPVLTGPIEFKIGGLKLTLPAQVAQPVQSVLASLLHAQGYQVIFSDKTGVLVIGDKICDSTQSVQWNKGCKVLTPDGGRF